MPHPPAGPAVPATPPRRVTPKLWQAVGVASALGAAGLSGALAAPLPTAPAPQAPPSLAQTPRAPAPLWQVQAEGGEGGEAGTAEHPGLTDDVALLALGRMQAELTLVGVALATGDRAGAQARLEAVANRQMGEIAPELEEHAAPDLQAPLQAIARLLARDAGPEPVAAAIHTAQSAMLDAQAAMISDPAMPFAAIQGLLGDAAATYGTAFDGGTLHDPVAYARTRALVAAARAMALRQHASEDAAVQKVAAKVLAILSETDPALPDDPVARPPQGDTALFAAAAARVDLAAWALRKG